MASEFRLEIANPKAGKTYKFELKGSDAEKLLGKKIGDKFNGAVIGVTGYELTITGGSDKSGFPMVKSISGSGRKTPLLAGGIGFRPKRNGERRRKTVVGNTISDSISQINCKVTKAGKEDIAKLLGAAPAKEEKGEAKKEKPKAKEPKPKEKPAEKKKEEKPSEDKKEEKKE